MMNKIINGKEIREALKQELQDKINKISESLKLVVIQVGDDPASNIYIKNKKKLCEELGILCEHKKFLEITEQDLIQEIDNLNNDKTVTGILVQLPLPPEIDETKIIEKISPLKDVDGLTSQNMGKLFTGNKALVPCTALGIIKMLEYLNIDLQGLNVTIVGRSKLVGLPLIALLLNKNCTVTVCHSKTKNLPEKTKKADALIVAVGQKELITKDYVKDDAIVIDVGINRYQNKLYGDCNFNELLPKCKYITPVPGGVGPLTVIMLINNIIEAYYLQK
mgnify:FL=1